MTDELLLPPRPPMVGALVHVASAGRCRPAIVLDTGPDLIRVRVLISAAVGDPGSLDTEGDVAHVTDLRIIPVPDEYGGGVRVLDSWHSIRSEDTCAGSLAMIAATLAGVVGS